MSGVLLEARNVSKVFANKSGAIQAVDGVNLSIRRGETLGLVGESGCGKSTLGRIMLGLISATGGEVLFDGQDVLRLGKRDLRELRRKMQIVFQDPYSCLNPRMTVGEIIRAPLDNFKVGTAQQRQDKTVEMLELVGLGTQHLGRYPHEFSGGQRQRVGIARALVLNPAFILWDEPVSALDVSVRAQVLTLMAELQKRFGLTYLFISHDLSVVRHISDRVAVMYLGQIVEVATRQGLYRDSRHPYTRALLASIPIPDPGIRPDKVPLVGDVSVSVPEGTQSACRFRSRCPWAGPVCAQVAPALMDVGLPEHEAACHLLNMQLNI